MGTPLLWIAFNVFVLLLLALDLGVFHRRAHEVSLREATVWSVFWVALSLLFNLGVLVWFGRTPAIEFFTGYLIEKSLSVDNVFVFALLFQAFAVEPRYQHRVLFWGILGALVMRGLMIGAGGALIHRFEWILYVFGAFLVFAGVRMMFRKEGQVHPERSPVLRWARKIIPVTKEFAGQRLFIREAGRLIATPLLLVVLVIEVTDLAFAVDSIPAVFGVTRDPFIVYTSNVFAILGLRAFYFLLAGVLPYFRYLGQGLSLVLIFIGAKMLAAKWLEIPVPIALAVVAGILIVAVAASVLAARKRSISMQSGKKRGRRDYSGVMEPPAPLSELISQLASPEVEERIGVAPCLYSLGWQLSDPAAEKWATDAEFDSLLVTEPSSLPGKLPLLATTVGIAVTPPRFEAIRAANGSPRLADVPPDQDALEFELVFPDGVKLDILTTKAPGGNGAIAKFLEKIGEGIQQVEYEVKDVDRATAIVGERFAQKPVYPQTRAGADGTRVNFFLAQAPEGKKVLIELVEAPRAKKPA
jgi:tellurite resistance protein TerC